MEIKVYTGLTATKKHSLKFFSIIFIAALIFGAQIELSAQTSAKSKTAAGARAFFKADIGRYHLQSNPWVNLQERFFYEVRFKEPSPAALSGEDLAKWKKAVENYGVFLGKKNPIFDDELIKLSAALSDTKTFKLPDSIPPGAKTALEAAMPLYRSAQWEKDDQINRFWIAMALPLLDSAGEELAEAHGKAYGIPFPTNIRVDVSPFGGEFGGYTVGEGENAHTVITSIEPGYQSFSALEMLMHEPSHAIVGSTSGAIGAELTQIAKELGVKPRYNLWHAILFYTSGELTRKALAKRGVRDYQPVVLQMYARGFDGFKKPLETHWQAYLDGKISREEAIRQMLIETTATIATTAPKK